MTGWSIDLPPPQAPPNPNALHWDMRKNLPRSATEIWGLFLTAAVLLTLTNTQRKLFI